MTLSPSRWNKLKKPDTVWDEQVLPCSKFMTFLGSLKWPFAAWRSMGTLFISAWVKAFQINPSYTDGGVWPHVISLSEQFFLCLQWNSLNLPEQVIPRLEVEEVWIHQPSSLLKTYQANGFELLFLSLLPSGQKTNILIISLSLSHAHTHTQIEPTWFWRCSNSNNIHKMVPTFLKLQCTTMPWLVWPVQSQTPQCSSSFVLIREQHTPHCCVSSDILSETHPLKLQVQDFWLRAISDVGHGSWRTFQVLPDAMLFPVSPLGRRKVESIETVNHKCITCFTINCIWLPQSFLNYYSG